MFEALKQFVADLGSRDTQPRGFEADDYRLAAVALLVHVAGADGTIDAAERVRLRSLIETRFGLDGAATEQLIATAEASDREAVDFFHFTHILKRELDDEGRHKIIEMMWEVAFADGAVHEFEENVVARVAELLGVSPRDRVIAKKTAAAEEVAPPAGPWGTPAPKP